MENVIDWNEFFTALGDFMLRVGWWNAALLSGAAIVWKHGYPWKSGGNR